MLRFLFTLAALFLLGLAVFGPDSFFAMLLGVAVGYVLLLAFGAVCAIREERRRKKAENEQLTEQKSSDGDV